MLYPLVLFLHVVGAMGLFGAIALEALIVARLRRATVLEDARDWLALFSRLRVLYGVSLGTILLAGAYMTSVGWGWTTPWIDVALAAMVLLAAVGAALTGIRMAALDREVNAERGALSEQLRGGLRDPRLWFSIQIRAAIAMGIVFLMTVKPDLPGALVTIVAAVVLGVASAALTSRTQAAPDAAWVART
jgi:hypothetical protein